MISCGSTAGPVQSWYFISFCKRNKYVQLCGRDLTANVLVVWTWLAVPKRPSDVCAYVSPLCSTGTKIHDLKHVLKYFNEHEINRNVATELWKRSNFRPEWWRRKSQKALFGGPVSRTSKMSWQCIESYRTCVCFFRWSSVEFANYRRLAHRPNHDRSLLDLLVRFRGQSENTRNEGGSCRTIFEAVKGKTNLPRCFTVPTLPFIWALDVEWHSTVFPTSFSLCTEKNSIVKNCSEWCNSIVKKMFRMM